MKTTLTAKDYIKLLSLERHVEGGYFNSFYRADDQVLVLDARYNDTQRCAGTSIYFLLEKEDFSAWHRVKSDEIWHFYDGDSPINLYIIDKDGELITHILGKPGQQENPSFQVLIKAGQWFAAEVYDKRGFSLMGCTVFPGFEYRDFELADHESLSRQFPKYAPLIHRLTRC